MEYLQDYTVNNENTADGKPNHILTENMYSSIVKEFNLKL